MFLKLRNPLVFFDLEATGTNVTRDRIVEYAFIKLLPNGEREKMIHRINPERPIPLESSLIHGIYDKDVKDAPTFKDVAKDLEKFLEGCDLSGFNILRFDIPMLVEEFLRADIEFDTDKRNLIDAQKIFHMMEKRNLAAAYKFYCGKSLEDAHTAEADTIATLEVLEAQVERYEGEDLTDLQGKTIGKIENDIPKLHEVMSDRMVDFAGRFSLNDEGIEVFNFGKHKGKPVEKVLKDEPGYYDWMMKGDFPLDTKRKLTRIKLKGFQR